VPAEVDLRGIGYECGTLSPEVVPELVQEEEQEVAVPRLVGLEHGPGRLVLVRHGESVGNLADAQAREQGAARLDLDARDADVELSETGRRQADALGAWMAQRSNLPDLVLSSPYARALETARRAVAGTPLEITLDERLRERDLGLFDGLTGAGIREEYAHEAERRKRVGKFYYSPPSGESWADVVLRVRSLLADLRHGFDGARVWMFTHQAVIMTFRYVLEGLTEQELLEIDRSTTIPNASLTAYRRGHDGLELECVADTSVVDAEQSTDVTHEPSDNQKAPTDD
jgi:broad specificity phosphatase PhoE